MLEPYKQVKGTSLRDLPTRLPFTNTVVEVKYDGHYISIQILEGVVRFFTSSFKEFYWEDVAEALLSANIGNCTLEAEYLGDGIGKLGGRHESSTATYRANFSKGIKNNIGGCLRVFNYIPIGIAYPSGEIVTYSSGTLYHDRLHNLHSRQQAIQHIANATKSSVIRTSIPTRIFTMGGLQDYYSDTLEAGYEGIMLSDGDAPIDTKVRTKSIYKVKPLQEAVLYCIGTISGTGKYTGLIGSLCLVDEDGIRVDAGSGLLDSDRELDSSYYIGRNIPIKYESKHRTYVQPRINSKLLHGIN